MKNKKILIAVLLIFLVIIAIILAAYFLNKESSTPPENSAIPNETQSSQTGEGQPENDQKADKSDQMEQFAKYIDFSQNGLGEIAENGEYVNNKYKFILHVQEVWKGNYRADVLDMTNEDAVVAYISLMYTFKGNEELLGKIVIADKETWETWEKSQMMTMPEVITRSADKSIIYGIHVVEENPLDEGSEAYEKFEAMRIRDVQMAKEMFALSTD